MERRVAIQVGTFPEVRRNVGGKGQIIKEQRNLSNGETCSKTELRGESKTLCVNDQKGVSDFL